MGFPWEFLDQSETQRHHQKAYDVLVMSNNMVADFLSQATATSQDSIECLDLWGCLPLKSLSSPSLFLPLSTSLSSVYLNPSIYPHQSTCDMF